MAASSMTTSGRARSKAASTDAASVMSICTSRGLSGAEREPQNT